MVKIILYDDDCRLIVVDQQRQYAYGLFMGKAHTGKFLKRNPTLLQAIADGIAAGIPKHELARTWHTSVESINAAMADVATAPTFEKVASARLERIISKQFNIYESALDKGEIKACQIPVAAGIFLDKRATLLNDTQVGPPESSQTVQSILDDIKSVTINNVQVNINQAQPIESKPVKPDIDVNEV